MADKSSPYTCALACPARSMARIFPTGGTDIGGKAGPRSLRYVTRQNMASATCGGGGVSNHRRRKRRVAAGAESGTKYDTSDGIVLSFMRPSCVAVSTYSGLVCVPPLPFAASEDATKTKSSTATIVSSSSSSSPCSIICKRAPTIVRRARSTSDTPGESSCTNDAGKTLTRRRDPLLRDGKNGSALHLLSSAGTYNNGSAGGYAASRQATASAVSRSEMRTVRASTFTSTSA